MGKQQPNTEQVEQSMGDRGIYDRNVDTLRSHLEADFEEGAERFGFALFHSLNLEDQLVYRERLGVECRDSVEHYNRGLAYASREDYENALKHWEKALEGSEPVAEATWNMGLVHERMGNAQKAVQSFRKYMEMVEDPQEKETVQKHIDELGG